MKWPRVSVQRLIKAVAFVLCFNIVVPLHAADSVAVENAKAGTSDWQLTYPANMWGSDSTDPNTYANVEIQGYASRTSVNQAETINFYIRTINTNPYNMSIYRIVWAKREGGRRVCG